MGLSASQPTTPSLREYFILGPKKDTKRNLEKKAKQQTSNNLKMLSPAEKVNSIT